ncbi:MAG: nucleotide sugar dehydrogenase, partial [Patescibacteria group bacterium]
KPHKTNIPAGIILVVEERKLLGIATDGDIRRALAGGTDLEASIGSIMNRNPFLVDGPKTNLEILSLVVDKIKHEHWHKDRLDKIVVVDKKRRVLDVIGFYDLWQASDMRFKHIGIVGLGYVGLTLALTLADLGFRVRGFDADSRVFESLRKGKAHIFEDGIDALMKEHSEKNLKIVSAFSGENNCDIYFVAVGTPLKGNKTPEMKHLEAAAKNIGKVLKLGDLVVLRSTVPVGTTRNVVLPILENESGLTGGTDFLLAFAPERTVEGKALEELRTLPQVIGGLNHASADSTANIFGFITNSNFILPSLEEAEMVKLVNNTYRDVTFAFANEISLVSRRWGIDTKRVIEAANHGYPRSQVPMPSPGVGGYCLEKDPYILSESAKAKNYDMHFITHARAVSERMIDSVASEMKHFLTTHHSGRKNPKIFLLGFAFKGKPATSDMRGSTTVKLAERLRGMGYTNIFGYDPVVKKADISAIGVKHAATLERGFEGACAVGIMNNHIAFEGIDLSSLFKGTANPTMFFDAWALYNPEVVAKNKGVHYARL